MDNMLAFEKPIISVIGLGYVGLPLLIAFAQVTNAIGYDIDEQKIKSYKDGKDITKETGDDEISKTTAIFTSNAKLLKKCNFHIIAVPTPVNNDNTPDLTPLISACEILGKNLRKGCIVVFESTVYPGVTEEICMPILEKASGLKCGLDFKIGYSPERINPGDKNHTLENIVKVVSAMDDESLDTIARTYEMIIKAGVYRANSIKTAEASKVIENTQRDINIAFVNEIAVILDKMKINTLDVLNSARTKWNFMPFYPGLVGGHCIGVDTYYLIHKSLELGYNPDIMIAARTVNNNMSKYLADWLLDMFIKSGIEPQNSNVLIMGIAFKENVSDVRNSGSFRIINELKAHGVHVHITDPVCDKKMINDVYGLELIDECTVNNMDAIIIAVAHEDYRKLDLNTLKKMYKKEPYILIDVKNLYNENLAKNEGYIYKSL